MDFSGGMLVPLGDVGDGEEPVVEDRHHDQHGALVHHLLLPATALRKAEAVTEVSNALMYTE